MSKATISFLVLLSVFLFASITSGQQSPSLRPIQQNGRWGYIDTAGKVVIKPQFYWAEEFSEGLAAFESDDGHYGYIDETGKVVIEPILERWSPFSEGLAAVAIKNREWGYIDKTGKWVIKPQFHYAYSFHDGFAAVLLLPEKNGTRSLDERESTIIDKTGKIQIKPVRYALNTETSKGVVFLQRVDSSPVGGENSKNLLVDSNGKTLVNAEDILLEGFSDGLTPVKQGGKWGYVDRAGRFVIKPKFDDAAGFSEGLAAVKVGEYWGYIDRTGKLVIPAKFAIDKMYRKDHAFSEGLALVYSGNDLVFIDKKGLLVLKPDVAKVERFIGGLAAVRNLNGAAESRGYIDKSGKFVWGPTPFRYKTSGDLRAQVKKREEKEGTGEKLTPLSDDEKKLNYRDIIANQPDFTAEMSYFRSHYVSGSGFDYKLTRKGNRFRKESQFWTFVGETGKSRVRLNPNGTYNDLEGGDDERVGGSGDFNPKLLAGDATIQFSPLGKIAIDGHECIKIAVKRKDAEAREEEIYLYAAKDLRNLVIVAQFRDSNATLVQRLQNISLEVPDALVQIPAEYKAVERDIWKKIENAKVKFDGKDAKDFGVFRAPGGELIVWINDRGFPPEYYLVRPKETVAEIVFLGLLVSREGKNIWQTSDTEALSGTHYRSPQYIEQTKSDASPVSVNGNTLSFPTRLRKDIRIEIILPG
jgi:hypothetical protein